MKPATTKHPNSFEVLAVTAGPDPDAERLYILTETERINKLIDNFRKPTMWSRLAKGATGKPKLEDLKHYRHKLASYRNTIDRYDQAMADGLIPFRIVIANTGQQRDFDIKIRVHIQDGDLHLAKTLPQRPLRVDSAVQHVMEPSTIDLSTHFVRSDMRIGRRSLAARFSELDSGADADLLNQTVFVQLSDDTWMDYELSSQLGGTVRGTIDV